MAAIIIEHYSSAGMTAGIMKSTLKVPHVIILLICINDVQGKELSL